MTPRTGAMCALVSLVGLVSGASVLGGCGSSQPGTPGPSSPSQMGTGGKAAGGGGGGSASGGSGGGNTGGTGSGGSTTAGPDAAPGGAGGGASGGATGQGGESGTPGTGGSAGGPGDAGPVTPPASEGDQPLPACKKSTPVAPGGLAAALATAQPGDCLLLADGNHTIPEINKTATEAAPLVIRAMNRGKAVVNAGSIHFQKASWVVVEGLDITTPGAATTFENGGSNGSLVTFTDSDHCRLSRTRIHPAGAPAERDWVVITGTSHHNRIDHNDMGPVLALANMLVINGTGQEEPQMDGQVCQYNRVDHNYMHEIHNTGGNNWEAMRIGRSWQAPTKGFNVIEHNFLDGASGDPETISVKSSDNIVRYNTMRKTAGEICLRHGNRNQVYGNYIIADGNGGSRGIRVYGADHRIFNNYIAAAQTGIWLDDGSATATDEAGKEHYQVYRAWVFNNTLIGQEIRIGGSKPNHPKDCKVANNIITGGAKVNAGGNAIVSEGNIEGGNPLTMQDGVFRLLANEAGAAAIGKAVNTAAYMLTDDIDGQPRTAPDVGADEQSSDPVKYKGPLTVADVGPDSL